MTVASDLRLPELPELHDDARPAALHVTVGPAMAPSSDPRVGARAERASVTRVRTPRGRLRIRFAETAEFVVSAASGEIEVRAWPGMAASTVRHLLIDQVIPDVLSMRGELVLHASGVALPGGAVLFVGPSGAGKSTLAAFLARRGWAVVCDDGARVVLPDGIGPVVAPSYPGLRLWPDGLAAVVRPTEALAEVAHDSSKRRWLPGGGHAASIPLACVCVLHDGVGRPAAGRMPAREALVELLDHSYRVPGTDPAPLSEQFDRAAKLVQTSPVIRLCYPYDFDLLPAVADLVESLVDDMIPARA